MYEEYVEKMDPDKLNHEVYTRLGDAYRITDKPEEAAKWYALSVEQSAGSPEDYFQYSKMLQQLERYDEAGVWFNKYKEATKSAKGDRGYKAAQNMSNINSNPLRVNVMNAQSVNSRRSDMGPAFYKEGVVFSSDRFEGVYGSRIFKWTGSSFYNIFYAESDGNLNFRPAELFVATLHSEYHDGPSVFTADGKEIIFTRNHTEKARVKKEGPCKNREVYNLKMMSSRYNEEKKQWSRPDEKAFVNLNNKNYLIAHPAISSDGKTLYFMSDNPDFPGYKGGSDLYMATLEGEVWSNPTNLGDGVNSDEDEAFPFIYQDTILFFASNGNIGNGGLGGLDVYMAKWDKAKGRFDNPVNLGTPINSSRDDFGFILREKSPGQHFGYFTSSRTASQDPQKVGGDDIYYFFPSSSLHLKVIAQHTERKTPFAQARTVLSSRADTLSKGYTNAEGIFFDFGVLDVGRDYNINATIEGAVVNKSFNTHGRKVGDTVEVLIEYCPVEITGTIINYLTNLPLADVEVEFTNTRTGLAHKATTDAEGKYHFFAQENQEYKLTAYKFGNVLEERTINTRGKKCETVEMGFELLPKERFLTNVYFFYNRADIYLYPESTDNLDNLVVFLKDNPNLKVELRSHTDSRGSARFNEQLGQRRAQSVKDYLIDKGISTDRLQPISYGEYCLVNNCADGVECTEVEHQRNRRTEIRVVNLQGVVVESGRELEKWTTKEDFYVPGGKYYEPGRGAGVLEPEVFQSKHGDWKRVTIRKKCE